MNTASTREVGRDDRVKRFERRMVLLARVVRAAFLWWDEVPPTWRYLAVVVVLQLLGFLPPAIEMIRPAG